VSELAARHGTAIIGVSHLNKTAGPQALMRVTGSLAFVAAARAAYLVTSDKQDKSRRLFLPMKNNLGPDEELARVDCSFATFFGVHSGLATGSIFLCGSEAQSRSGCRLWRAWKRSVPLA
jgi:hypothetical protein